MGTWVAYREGALLINVHTNHNIQGDTGSFVSKMMSILTACKEKPQDRAITIAVKNTLVLSTLARCAFSTYWNDHNKHPHKKLCEVVITALYKHTAITIHFCKVHAH